MLTAKELIERRTKLHEENRAAFAAAKDGVPTPEVMEACKARNKEMATLQEAADLQSLSEADERALSESRGRRTEPRTGSDVGGDGPNQDEIDLAFRGWALGRHAGVNHRDAAIKAGLRLDCPSMQFSVRKRYDEAGKAKIHARAYLGGAESDLRVTGSEIRAFNRNSENGVEERALGGSGAAGDYTIPNELMRAMYEYRKYFGPMRQAAEEMQTETGATLPWPTVDDTGNTGEIIGESSAVTTTADPTFGIVNLGAFKFSSKAILVPVELLQDSSVNLPQYLGKALGTRIGRINNTKFTTGAGTTEPAGIITRSTQGVTAAATNAFIFDEIMALVHSVDPAYRPFCSFSMHDSVALVVRQLKDGFGRYIWEQSTQIGQPDRLLGYPVWINNDMSSTFAATEKVMLFGLMKNYLIRDAGPVLLLRSDEIRILNHQVVFLAIQRSDGNLIDTTSSKYLGLHA